MYRTIFGRLAWLGRATSAVVGLAVVLALVVGSPPRRSRATSTRSSSGA